MQQQRGREVHKLKATYFAGYAFQRFLFESLYPTMKKKKSKKLFFQPAGPAPAAPPTALRQAVLVASAQDPWDRRRIAPLHPHRLPVETAAGRGSSTREGKGTGARRALSDKDRGFMINLGRFKYLLSQGFRGGEESPSQSQSCHLLTSGQCQPNSLIFTEEMRRPLCGDLK